ncbi:uncharacterized protein LOC144142287 isoform X2 [Haemaphysalis longicornis]
MAYEQQQRGHGYVVAISIPTGTLRAKIYDGSTADIVKCAKCGFVPEKFYKLDCQHILCTYCARFTGSYTCVTDNTTTEIAMPMLAPVLENIPLKFSLVDCPACGQTFQYRGIKKHVQKKHPNLWEEGNQHASYDDKAHEETNTGDRVLPATPTNPSSVTEATFKEERHKATTHRLEAEAVLKKQGSQREILPVFQRILKLQPYSALRKMLVFNYSTLSTGVLSMNKPGCKVELMISITGHTCEWRRPWVKDELCCPVAQLHVAAMFRIHHGEGDDLLPWPFAHKVAVLLVNHLEEANSILLKLDSGDADGDSFKKPVRGTPNLKFGFPRVISLQQIENPKEGFLIQDSIVFKFTIQ